MHTLIIQHIGTNPDKFEVMRLQDGKRTPAVKIPSQSEFKVQGCPDSNLSQKLRWYLESFLDYPFEPDTDVAEYVLDGLKEWGEAAFNALFDNRNGADMLKDAIQNGYNNLHLKISSDDPRVLAWNWEALSDPKAGTFAHLCQIERKLNQILDPVPFSEKLPKDCVNILLVTARPFENDVRYRSISRLLVEMIESQNLPAKVHVLRPPTFDNLREHLRKHPNFYHILHFDGHGAYGNMSPENVSGFTFKGKKGCLAFETEDGKQDLILTEQLSALLREHAVPAIVLNACQSGMIDDTAKDPFASVAASLLKSGVRSVLAMAYSLRVSGAQVFLPEFYRMLFETGSMEKAVRSGRQQMFSNPKRICARGKFPLQDWLVPVLYQQETSGFSFVSQSKPKAAQVSLPSEIADEENPYGFIGRDKPILEIERAMRSKCPAILLHGLGGVGKTTLAKGFVKWLSQTQGLGKGCFWFAFNDIRNAESVLNRMGEALFGGNFSLDSVDERLNALVSVFKEHQFIIIWDNFESVYGIEGTEVKPLMNAEQQTLLASFLKKLRNGHTKVIITSRSDEDWIKTERRKIDISGLDGDERWLFLNEIVQNLGIKLRQDDADLIHLMNMLNGHPLAMRVILPMLEKQSAKTLINALQSDLDTLKQENDETASKLYATLGLAQKALPDELKPLLILLGLHERLIVLSIFEPMAKKMDRNWTSDKIQKFADALSHLGLLNDRRNLNDSGQVIYELHPMLSGYLRAYVLKYEPKQTINAWTRAFVDEIYGLSLECATQNIHEIKGFIELFKGNFYNAIKEVQLLLTTKDDKLLSAFSHFIQIIGSYLIHIRNYKEATDLYFHLAKVSNEFGNQHGEAMGYLNLGLVSQNTFEYEQAESWYKKALDIFLMIDDEVGKGGSYADLGFTAKLRRDFDGATKWYQKAIESYQKCEKTDYFLYKMNRIKDKIDGIYLELAQIEDERWNFENAEEQLNSNSLETGKAPDILAQMYLQMGILAQEKGNTENAEKYLNKSFSISIKLEDKRGIASIYHHMGIIARKKGDFERAEKLYRASINIKEKLGDEFGAALTYHQMGELEIWRMDFEMAEKWHIKALNIFEKYGKEHNAALTYFNLGNIKNIKRDTGGAGKAYLKALCLFISSNDSEWIDRTKLQFSILHNRANQLIQTNLKAMWESAGLPPFV